MNTDVNIYNIIWADDECFTLKKDENIRRMFDDRGIEVLEFVPTSEELRKALDKFKDKVDAFLEAAETLVRQSIKQYERDGRDHLQVAFGCTGGQHRSVYFAERMAERLTGIEGVEVEVSHAARSYWGAK